MYFPSHYYVQNYAVQKNSTTGHASGKYQLAGTHKATPSGITVSGLGHSLLSRRAGGSTHYAIIHHSNLKVI